MLDNCKHIDRRVREADKALERIARASDAYRRLMTVPGVGVTGTVAFTATADNTD